ncbi:hypothetical protein FOA52_010895 [Chlamydomonas sp. UWO 241]|nr:hypothetical protein FOA52_010895 [Chlamydomonas sp. UWO 241]
MDGDEPPEAVAIGQSVEPERVEDERLTVKNVPVTVITGFLGSGKTTLVRHILNADHGYRVAVIMNEYGDSVEGSYFETPEGSKANLGEWVDLSNGCMCCAVKTEFVQAIETLLLKRDKFDYILIETTGLANPGPIASALWSDEEQEAGCQLDSMVVVVDAINIDRQLNDPRPDGAVNEAQVQLAYADVILLNKMDLASEEAVERAEADIKAINSSVQIVRTKHCDVDLGAILNRKGYSRNAEALLECINEVDDEDEEVGSAEDSDGRGRSPPPGDGARVAPHASLQRSRSRHVSGSHGHTHTLGDIDGSTHAHAHHDERIQTCTLRHSAPIDLEKVKAFMDRLLWDRELHPEDIYRVKGLLEVDGSDTKHVVQAVYELYNITPTSQWLPGRPRETKIVLIGRNLKQAQLQEWLDACVA